jgi:hypothetical protein
VPFQGVVNVQRHLGLYNPKPPKFISKGTFKSKWKPVLYGETKKDVERPFKEKNRDVESNVISDQPRPLVAETTSGLILESRKSSKTRKRYRKLMRLVKKPIKQTLVGPSNGNTTSAKLLSSGDF